MSDFRIELSSDLDYEKMVVDIIYLDNLLAKIQCDEGINNSKVLFFDKRTENPIWELDLISFMKVLNEAFDKLKKTNI